MADKVSQAAVEGATWPLVSAALQNQGISKEQADAMAKQIVTKQQHQPMYTPIPWTQNIPWMWVIGGVTVLAVVYFISQSSPSRGRR